jgi:hypothetical protein
LALGEENLDGSRGAAVFAHSVRVHDFVKHHLAAIAIGVAASFAILEALRPHDRASGL